jgi:PhoPQ-activated pathogenicity-related protein
VFSSDPSQKGRTEDPLLAWAFKIFHDEPSNTEAIPLLPMAKAAFQGMRAAQDYINNQLKVADIEGWVVAGASKRGWTTWMTGVAQCSTCVKVLGIMPLVPIVPAL